MASIKDIAKICGVSVATVSKALNDKNDIGEETKKRIKDVAKEMGYFPQYYARAIRMNKSYNIGVLFMDQALSGLTHDYFANILNSFKVTAESKGYDITFINGSKDYKKSKTYLEHCRYRGLDGIVIACIDFDNPEVIELLESNIPLVMIDHQYEGCLSVMSDNIKGMRDLTEYVISMGHTKIAYMYGEMTQVTKVRLESFLNVMHEHGIMVPQEYLVSSGYRDLQKASAFTKQLLSLKEPPTCILYSDDYSAVGGMECIRDEGYRIPEDISVAGYDGIFIASQLQPRLATIHQDTKMLGEKAAEQLIAVIEKKKKLDDQPVIVACDLQKGESIGKKL